MDDENVSIINIIDGIVDDARVFVIYLNVILMTSLFISVDLTNTSFFYIMSWITIVITALDVLLTVIDVVGAFIDGDFGEGFFSSVINVAIISISIIVALKFIDLTGVQLSHISLISVGATVFCLLSLIFSTIIHWSVLFENIRLVLIFCIVIVGMYNLFGANIGGQVSDYFVKIGSVMSYIIGGIIVIDFVLCLVDLFKGVIDDFNGWDILTIVLNVIIFASLVLGVIFAEDLFDLFLDIFNLKNITITISFSNRLLIGFILYIAVDLLLAVLINLLSNIGDIVENSF